MKLFSRVLLSFVAAAAVVLFLAGTMHCVIECHEDDSEDGCGCFCHVGISDLPAHGDLSFVLASKPFICLSSDNVDSVSPGGVFRPPIA